MPNMSNNSEDEFDVYFYIELVTNILFAVELLVKFLVCPNKIRFLISPFTILDFLSIVPYYIYLIVPTKDPTLRTIKNISRIFRACTLLKVFEKSEDLNSILNTLKKSYVEICVFFAYLCVGMLIFSTMLYYVEYEQPETLFDSIPGKKNNRHSLNLNK
jgi:hypothetical protein